MIELPLREALARSQVELNPSGDWPVRIAQIASLLGIALHFRAAHAQEVADLEIGEHPVITIYRRSNHQRTLDGNERFSVAHELGHWILWRRARAVPGRASEYWLHEALCNEFAAELLVPRVRLQKTVEKLRQQNVRSIFFPATVARAANVSWSVAARAITSLYPTLGYLRLVSDSTRRLFVSTSSISRRLGCFVGERAFIRDGAFLNAAQELAPGKRRTMRTSFEAGALHVMDAPCVIMRENGSRKPTFIVAVSLCQAVASSSSNSEQKTSSNNDSATLN
jgi:uncharacterized protein DUF955